MAFVKFTRYEADKYLNEFVGKIKTTALSNDVVYSLVKFKIELTKVIEDINKFRKELIVSIPAPEGFEALRSKANSDDASEEDKNEFAKVENEYNSKLSEVAIPYFNEVIKLEFIGLSEAEFKSIIEAKDLDVVFGYEYIYNKLVKVFNDDETQEIGVEEVKE
jgi:hypothetical protein